MIVGSLAVSLYMVFAVFSLARYAFGLAVAVLCAAFMFVPCISLLVLLVVNVQAIAVLQSRGIRVGLLGADLRDVP
jgi:hypothetical protein